MSNNNPSDYVDVAPEEDNDFATPSEDMWDEEDDMIEVDGESEYSNIETEEEQKAWVDLSIGTKDSFFYSTPVLHPIPTSLEHFQSSDGFTCIPAPSQAQGSIAASCEILNLQLHHLPAAPQLTGFGVQPVTSLGGFDQQIFETYSMSLSQNPTDGKKGYLAVAGDHGCLALYTLHVGGLLPNHEGFAPAQGEPIFSTTGLTITHANMGLDGGVAPEELVKLIRWHAEGNWTKEWRARAETLEELYSKDSQHMDSEWGGLWAWNHPAPQNIWEAYREALARCNQMSGIEPLMPTYHQTLVNGVERNGVMPSIVALETILQEALTAYYAANPAMKRPTERCTPPLILNTLFTLGFADEAEARQQHVDSDMMANGVRHGLVGGKQRMLVANQDGYIYIFEDAHNEADAHGVTPEERMCLGLNNVDPQKPPTTTDKWRMRPVNAFTTHRVFLGVGMSVKPKTLSTAAIGPLGVPANFAMPSRNGRWIAAAVDLNSLILIDQQDGYSRRSLPMEAPRPESFEYGFEGEQDLKGGQYVAWNSDSSLVAVTSDALHAVFVFEPVAGSCIMRVIGHAMPCLSLLFVPWDPTLLVYAEHSKHIHVRKVIRRGTVVVVDGEEQEETLEINVKDDLGADARGSMQLLRFPRANDEIPGDARGSEALVMHDFDGARRRINGLTMTADGDLLVATNQRLVFRYLGLRTWSPQKNKLWPEKCREAMKTLLLCHAHESKSGELGIWSLPQSAVMRIAELLAGEREGWLEGLGFEMQPPKWKL